jgi:hypothetical protein
MNSKLGKRILFTIACLPIIIYCVHSYHLVWVLASCLILVCLFEYYKIFHKILETRTGIEEKDFVNRLSVISPNTLAIFVIPLRALVQDPGSVGSSILLEGILLTFVLSLTFRIYSYSRKRQQVLEAKV